MSVLFFQLCVPVLLLSNKCKGVYQRDGLGSTGAGLELLPSKKAIALGQGQAEAG